MSDGAAWILGAFLVAAAAEMVWPWRPAPPFAIERWLGNLALMLFAAGFELLLAPMTALLDAGSINGAWPFWVQVAIGISALDALNYALHRIFHASPLLWRLHALHHADPELDVSTTVRHHPAEALLMGLLVSVPAAAAGLSLEVIGFYVTLNLVVQFFAHANLALPAWLTNPLGWLLVTPALHRVHHSRHPDDVGANYGLVFSVWDRLFSTLRSNPAQGEQGIEFGVERLREPYYQRFDRMLWLPLWVRQDP
jgi:sterol desaturase/sphingolipid hydroxylase (fatty acid hydroxylase superfamily)